MYFHILLNISKLLPVNALCVFCYKHMLPREVTDKGKQFECRPEDLRIFILLHHLNESRSLPGPRSISYRKSKPKHLFHTRPAVYRPVSLSSSHKKPYCHMFTSSSLHPSLNVHLTGLFKVKIRL